MKAILIKQPGNADQLELGEFPTPIPKDNELLVRIHATSLNRADILQREGKYPPPPGASPILGLDLAGVVEKTGPACTEWKPGDRVMALLPGGGYAEYATIPEKLAMPIPKNLSFEEAAAIPEVFLTAFQTLFWLGDMKEGQNVLIHAGASGVGTAAIQLAREAKASLILITAGSEEKINACKNLGATHGFNYRSGPFADAVLETTSKKGVSVILDFIGAPYWDQNLKALGIDGRLILIAAMGGVKGDNFNLLPFLLKRIQVIGTTLRARSEAYKTKLTEEFSRFALDRFEKGTLKPVLDKIYPWQEVGEAHRRMESNQNVGKIILRVQPV